MQLAKDQRKIYLLSEIKRNQRWISYLLGCGPDHPHLKSALYSIVLNNQVLIHVQVVNRFQPVSRANGKEHSQQELGYKLDKTFNPL